MNVTGMGAMPPPPPQMRQQMDDAFSAADVDESGGVTLEELTTSLEEQGVAFDQQRLETHYAEMDADGNGEVTDTERQEHLDSMRERLEGSSIAGGVSVTGMLGGTANGFAGPPAGESMTNLLEEIAADQAEGSELKAGIEGLLAKIETEGFNGRNIDSAMGYVSGLVGSVNTTA